ncbi:Abi family protein [Francisellaceae bacterium CB300]
MVIKQSIKSWTSYQEQVEILKNRGMAINDESKAIKYLQNINYYRLSGYSYIFRYMDDNNNRRFRENTHFTDVKELYVFDKRLRLLVLDAIETIEISLKANFAYTLGKYDSLAHLDEKYFDLSIDNKNTKDPNWRINKFNKLQKTIKKNIDDSSKEDFIKHHLNNYNGIPIWVALEVCTFGNLSVMFSLLKSQYAKEISKIYNINSPLLFSRLIHSITIIRNISSHHGRLWNKRFGHSIKDSHTIMDNNMFFGNRNFFFFALAINYLLKEVLPNTSWLKSLDNTINKCLKDTSDSISKEFIYKNMGINLKGYSSPNK